MIEYIIYLNWVYNNIILDCKLLIINIIIIIKREKYYYVFIINMWCEQQWNVSLQAKIKFIVQRKAKRNE